MKVEELLLTAALKQKSGIDQIVPLLKIQAKSDPKYESVSENYNRIKIELDAAVDALKRMI